MSNDNHSEDDPQVKPVTAKAIGDRDAQVQRTLDEMTKGWSYKANTNLDIIPFIPPPPLATLPPPAVVVGHPKDGLPDCQVCHNHRVVPSNKPRRPGFGGPGAVMPCECTIAYTIRDHIFACWKTFGKQLPEKPDFVPTLPTDKNLWITGTNRQVREALFWSLFTTMYRGRYALPFKVATDIDTMDSWLGKDTDEEIYDGDVRQRRDADQGIEVNLGALVKNVPLLILRTGFKASANKETGNVVLESLMYRQSTGLPTWFVDSDEKPFVEGHLAWTMGAVEVLEDFERVRLVGGKPTALPDATKPIVEGSVPHSQDPRHKKKGGVPQ